MVTVYIDNRSYFTDFNIYYKSGYAFLSNLPCVSSVRGLQSCCGVVQQDLAARLSSLLRVMISWCSIR